MNIQLPDDLFLTIPYGELEELNVAARDKRDTVSLEDQESEYRSYLERERRIRTVTLCFSDLEGRFHMLDYDKKFLLDSADNLTFDGSSIRGFTAQHESDLYQSLQRLLITPALPMRSVGVFLSHWRNGRRRNAAYPPASCRSGQVESSTAQQRATT